jgi:2-methylcitrate dehydratase PrpD
MFDLVEKERLGFDQMRKLRVSLNKTAVEMHGIFPRYKGKFEALLSIHYSAAAILRDRALTLAQFEPERYNDPVLARFAAEQVEVKVDPALSGVQCQVEAQTVDGRTISVRCDHPRGSPENPLTRAQIQEKFRTYARALLPGAAWTSTPA